MVRSTVRCLYFYDSLILQPSICNRNRSNLQFHYFRLVSKGSLPRVLLYYIICQFYDGHVFHRIVLPQFHWEHIGQIQGFSCCNIWILWNRCIGFSCCSCNLDRWQCYLFAPHIGYRKMNCSCVFHIIRSEERRVGKECL